MPNSIQKVTTGTEQTKTSKDSSRSTFNLNSKKVNVNAKVKSLQIRYAYPLYHDLHVSLNLDYELQTEDIWTSRFYSAAVPDSITEVIHHMLRIVAPDLMGDKKRKQWLVTHSILRGTDKVGNEVKPLPRVSGQDMQLQVKRNYDPISGEEQQPTPGKSFVVYTQEFSPELVDKLINESIEDPLKERHYSITTPTYPAGFGCSLAEFKELSIEELERGF